MRYEAPFQAEHVTTGAGVDRRGHERLAVGGVDPAVERLRPVQRPEPPPAPVREVRPLAQVAWRGARGGRASAGDVGVSGGGRTVKRRRMVVLCRLGAPAPLYGGLWCAPGLEGDRGREIGRTSDEGDGGEEDESGEGGQEAEGPGSILGHRGVAAGRQGPAPLTRRDDRTAMRVWASSGGGGHEDQCRQRWNLGGGRWGGIMFRGEDESRRRGPWVASGRGNPPPAARPLRVVHRWQLRWGEGGQGACVRRMRRIRKHCTDAGISDGFLPVLTTIEMKTAVKIRPTRVAVWRAAHRMGFGHRGPPPAPCTPGRPRPAPRGRPVPRTPGGTGGREGRPIDPPPQIEAHVL